MFEKVHTLNTTGQILNMLGQKQKIIGQNMANVDTPGYTKKTINFADYMNTNGFNSLEKKINDKFGMSSTSVENTGESVNMGDEIVDMQKNSLLYSMAVRRMSSVITELRTAINVGK